MSLTDSLRKSSGKLVDMLRGGAAKVIGAQTEIQQGILPEEGQAPVPSVMGAIGHLESRGEKNPYSFSRYSGKKQLGSAMGKYQVTEGELKDYSKMYLGRDVSKKEFMSRPDLQNIYTMKKIERMRGDLKMSDEDILRSQRGGLNVKPGKHQGYVDEGMKFMNKRETISSQKPEEKPFTVADRMTAIKQSVQQRSMEPLKESFKRQIHSMAQSLQTPEGQVRFAMNGAMMMGDITPVTQMPVSALKSYFSERQLKDMHIYTDAAYDGKLIDGLAKAYKSGGQVTPIEVFQTKAGTFFLDGWHRFHGALKAGIKNIPVRVIDLTK